ncbi:MAG TPA: hypothetical protein PK686_02740 [bacterium]|nr:hypothetical protein [bacterium]HPV65574.1 hypothetical protein [bacterium]
MKRLRKIFASLVMVTTVLTTVGAFAPSVNAAAQAGDLIKKDGLSAVYYLGEDGKRYVFPNEATYKSWYSDFSGVVTVSADELASYPLGANVVIRPGTKLVKITTDPKVYAVEPNGSLRWVQTEADAIALYGANWAQRVVDVADSFFTNYTIGQPLSSNEVPVGSLVKKSGENSIYYYDGTNYRLIEDEVAFLANRFQNANVLTLSSFTAGGTTITGAEAAIVKTSQSGQSTGWKPGQGTGVTVALNSMTPASQSVPSTVGRIPFTKVNFTASTDGATHLESITVKRTGLTTYGTTFKVWAEKDGVTITSKRTLTSNDDAVLTFAPALTIAAGQTVTLEILAEVEGVSGNGALGIVSASAVSASGATVSGSFPVVGNLMSFTTYDVTGLKLTTPSSVSSLTLKVGDEDVELAKFNLALTGTTTRDVVFKTLTLRNNGVEDLASTVMNMHLENAGEKVSENATFNGRYATFVLKGNGMDLLRDENNYDFIVKGDIIGKDNSGNNSITLRLNKKDELYAYEKATGFGITYDYNDGVDFDTIKIESGSVDISKKSTSPAAQDVIKGAKDVVVLLANVKADEVINADSLRVNYEGDENSFQNAKVYLNNSLLGSFDLKASTTPGGQFELIDSSLTLNKGNNEVKVTVDVKTNAIIGRQFKASLNDTNLLTAGVPEYASNGLAVTDINGTASGEYVTVSGGGMTFVRNDGYTDGRKIVQGTTDVSLGKFNIKATDDAIKLTSISLGGNISTGTATTSPSHIYDMKLFIDGVQVGSTRNFTSAGATFSSLNYSIAKNAIKSIELKGSLTSEAAGVAGTEFKTKMTVNAQDSLGKTIDAKFDDTVNFAVTAGGTLTIAKGASTPYSNILIAKAGVEQEIAQFRLTAVDDSANITELKLVNVNPTATTTVVTTTDSRISHYSLYKGTTLLDTTNPILGVATFSITGNKLIVPANGSETITLKAVFNPIEVKTDTGKELALIVKNESIVAKSSNGSELAQANISGENLALSNHMVVRKTKPTFSKVNGIVGSASSAQEVARFKVAADANEDLRLTAIAFTVSNTGGAVDSYSLYEVGNPKALATATDGNFSGFELVVNKGTDKTLRVTANTILVGADKTFGLSLSNVAETNKIAWGEYFVTGYEDHNSTYVEELPLDFGSMKY